MNIDGLTRHALRDGIIADHTGSLMVRFLRLGIPLHPFSIRMVPVIIHTASMSKGRGQHGYSSFLQQAFSLFAKE